MPCYYPIDGWRAKIPNPDTGRYPIVFNKNAAQQDNPVTLACGRCIGCRLEKSRQWAMRCVYESKLHEDNCFITLTYNEESVPSDGSLVLRDWQLFIKRLRKQLHPKKVRFYMCGEYGTDRDLTTTKTILGRPHYHAILFGHDFADKEVFSTNPKGDNIYISENLTRHWGLGHCTLSEMTFDSAAYVARYCMKKITGDMADDHYASHDPLTGELTQRKPEFNTMSRKHGIGYEWFQKYRHDLDKGFLTISGVKYPPPKYFNDLYAKEFEEDYEAIKERKRVSMDPDDPENRTDRLRIREQVKLRKLKQLKRHENVN
nr:MAG: replication initiation protein [Microvirus sp.]